METRHPQYLSCLDIRPWTSNNQILKVILWWLFCWVILHYTLQKGWSQNPCMEDQTKWSSNSGDERIPPLYPHLLLHVIASFLARTNKMIRVKTKPCGWREWVHHADDSFVIYSIDLCIKSTRGFGSVPVGSDLFWSTPGCHVFLYLVTFNNCDVIQHPTGVESTWIIHVFRAPWCCIFLF